MTLYYSQNNIVVRKATMQDAEYLKDKLRESDVKEVWASNHLTAEEALKTSLEKSIFALTVQNGHPLAIFGICPESVLGKKATIFMLSSPELDKIRIRFAKKSRYFIRMLLEFYGYLENYVHVDNKQSIKWLRMCGATIETARPYGLEGEMFNHFYFKKG